MQIAQIGDMHGPSTRVLTAFRHYVDGNTFTDESIQPLPIISGRAKTFLGNKSDLVSLRKAADEDLLSRFLQDHWAFQTRKTSDPLDRTMIYRNKHVVQTVATLSMVIASILLISAILGLRVVTSSKAKLGLVAMYTLLFALSVSLLTNARRAEVFAATAAYATVLVVFVSGDLGGIQGEKCLIQLDSGIFKVIRCPS